MLNTVTTSDNNNITKFNAFRELVTGGTQSQAERDWYALKQDRLYMVKITRHLRGKFYESFVKIGWTTEFDLQNRFNWFPASFQVELIDTISLPKSIAHQTELSLHRHYKPFKYVTRSKFSGKEEAYTLHLLEHFSTLQDMIDNIKSQESTLSSPYSLN
jgi:hypothetical protein